MFLYLSDKVQYFGGQPLHNSIRMIALPVRPARPNEANDIIGQAQRKVSRSLVDEVSVLSGLTKKEIASLIGLTERALFKTPKSDFSILVSEHLLLLKQLFNHGLAVFDNRKKVLTKWLRTPLPELASPQTGFFPVSPPMPPPPLEQMTAREPYDLMAYSIRQNEQADRTGSIDEKRPYPTPVSLLNTSTGIGMVDDVFTRIEAGVYV